jgi:hypothetical protein
MYTHIGYRQLLGNFFAPVSGGFETRLYDLVIRGVDLTARIVIPLPVRKPVPARAPAWRGCSERHDAGRGPRDVPLRSGGG